MSLLVEAHLDNVFIDAAKRKEKQLKGKVLSYELFDDVDYITVIKSGKCEVVSVRYDKHLDCDVIKCKDIDTSEEMSAIEFCIKLKEES